MNSVVVAVFGLVLATAIATSLAMAWRTRRVRRSRDQLSEQLTAVEARLDAAEKLNRDWAKDAETLVEERLAIRRSKLNASRAEVEQLKLRLRGLAHDIRNPLLAIRFASEELKDALLEPDARERVADQLEGLDRCSSLISHMLTTVGGPDSPDEETPGPCTTRVLVSFIRTRLRTLAGRNLDERVSVELGCPEQVDTKQVLLERILDNLLANAFEHARGQNVSVHVSGSEHQLVVRISDDGPGLPDALIDSLLRSRHAKAPESRGLGLSVVVDLLEQLDGQLEIHTLAGSGTTFWIRVGPQSKAASSSEGRASRVSVRPGATSSLPMFSSSTVS